MRGVKAGSWGGFLGTMVSRRSLKVGTVPASASAKAAGRLAPEASCACVGTKVGVRMMLGVKSSRVQMVCVSSRLKSKRKSKRRSKKGRKSSA